MQKYKQTFTNHHSLHHKLILQECLTTLTYNIRGRDL